ncbi:MAG: signal transduction histidine kinase with receiver domain [Deltaproteobacteria bacterium]|nr:signal transduction histidine kinase with receiver domain [Deltaproteobacteria bacterium]
MTTNPRIQNRKIASTNWAELSRLRSEDWAITPAYTSSYSGEIVFTISRGFRDQKGNHLGVVSCTAVASKLDSLFALPRSNHAGISLIDNKGMHVYRYPPAEYTLEQRNWLKLYPVPIGEALKGKEVFTTQASKISGTNRLVAFVPIPSVGWVASCSRAEKEVMAGIVRSLLPQTILILLVTIGALGTAVGLSRPITVSLVKLKNQAEAIGRGERERAEVEAGPGELMELTDTLNQMIEKLRLGEEALRESEEKYRKLVKYAPAAIYEMDLQGTKFLSVNEAMCDILGYSRDELLSMKPVDLIDRQSGELFSDRIKRNLAGERLDETAEYRVRRKDGEWITAAISAGAITYSDEKPDRVIVIAYDITERKRMEEALRESEDKYRTLLEHSLQGTWVIQDMRAVFCNQTFADMGGWTIPEVLSWSPEELSNIIHPDDQKRVWGRFRERLEGKQLPLTINELRAFRKDGSVAWIEYDARKITLSGRPAMLISVLDITERKRAEEALRKAHDELEIRVQERTSELALANEQLKEQVVRREKAEEQLREAVKLEAIGTLTSGIAHDFNNILGAIIINSELALLDLPDGSGIRNNLDLILKSGLHGKDLVAQMLLFSRRSEKKQAILTLTPLIKESFRLLRSSIPTTIQMELHLETESDAVFADPSQIQQVIMNLCTNAAYAMRGTMGSIDIRLQDRTFGLTDLPEADMQPGNYLVLSVKDTGSGMDDEVKKRIFEPFFTTKPVGEGTGLGLSVVYGIVKSHKGNITVYSEPGKGSIFNVYLPKVDTGVSRVAETLGPVPRGKERILLVDDEEMTMNSVRNMLQHLGYKVTALTDSQEALECFSANPFQFDLVMTDQTMPFMTGGALGKELMRIRPDIPVILCTGYSDMISSEKVSALGFPGFIMKPFTVREGADLVRSVLDQTRY